MECLRQTAPNRAGGK